MAQQKGHTFHFDEMCDGADVTGELGIAQAKEGDPGAATGVFLSGGSDDQAAA